MKARKPTDKKGDPFVMLYLSFLENPALARLTVSAWRALRVLLIEHLEQGGRKNGNLVVTQEQFEAAGIYHNGIAPAIRQLEAEGLIVVVRGGLRGGVETPSRFGLTFVKNAKQALAPNQHPRRKPVDSHQNSDRAVRKTSDVTVTKTDTATVTKMVTPGGAVGHQNSDRKGPSDGHQNSDTYLESTYQDGANRLGVEEDGAGAKLSPVDELFWVPHSWVTGKGFKPALCGIKPPSSASFGKQSESDPDGWLRDEFYYLRARAGGQP
jgi:hypothetical protein